MRQFVSPRMPEQGVVTAEGEDYRHLRRVLRVRVGDMVSVRLPDASAVNATVCLIDDDKGAVRMEVCATQETPLLTANRFPLITLFQFIPRLARMEVILRQAVECAVDTVVPVAGEYSQMGYVEAMKDGPTPRMQRVIKEAMEQSGAAYPITVTRAMSVGEAIKWWGKKVPSVEDRADREEQSLLCDHRSKSQATIAIVLSERNSAFPYDVFSECRNIKKAAIAVGSEGGISIKEEEQLNQAGFRSVHFGCNIMRCETAALYGAAVLREVICTSNF